LVCRTASSGEENLPRIFQLMRPPKLLTALHRIRQRKLELLREAARKKAARKKTPKPPEPMKKGSLMSIKGQWMLDTLGTSTVCLTVMTGKTHLLPYGVFTEGLHRFFLAMPKLSGSSRAQRDAATTPLLFGRLIDHEPLASHTRASVQARAGARASFKPTTHLTKKD